MARTVVSYRTRHPIARPSLSNPAQPSARTLGTPSREPSGRSNASAATTL
jgi:hypothetical protein